MAVVIVIAVILVFNYLQNRPVKPPQMSFSEEDWDFGIVKPNDVPTHVFMVKNEGGEDLIIERVRASCGCVKASISTKRIPPGGTTQLKATFDTAGYDGKVEKDIYIKSNDPQEEGTEKKISLYAEVEHQSKPVISASQNEWNLGLISQGDRINFDFLIENRGDEDLVINKIDNYQHIFYSIDLPLIISPQEKYKFTLTYDSTEHDLGEIREAMMIFSNDPRKKAIALRISGYIKEKVGPEISISPVGLDFDLKNDSGKEITEKFTLANLGEKAAKIVSVGTSADYLTLLLSEFDLESEEKKDLEVVLLKDKALGEMQEEESDEYVYVTIALPVKVSK